MKKQETQREKNRHMAVALLALLLLWVIVGSSRREKVTSPEPHECVGIITVVGDVASPGTFLLKGSKENKECTLPLKHIVRAAGGIKGTSTKTLPHQEESRLPLGQKVVVTRLDSGSASFHLEPLDGEKQLVWGEKLDINRASPEALSLIPRMREEFAQSIVERRAKRPWRRLQDLAEIRGVGPKTVELWGDYLEVKGVE